MPTTSGGEGRGRPLVTDSPTIVPVSRRAMQGLRQAVVDERDGPLPAMLVAAITHEVVIGSRYIPGGVIPKWSLLRRLLSRGGNQYASLMLGLHVADSTSGFRVYHLTRNWKCSN